MFHRLDARLILHANFENDTLFKDVLLDFQDLLV